MEQASFQQALTANSSTRKDALGVIRTEGPRRFRYVQFSGTTAVAANDFVSYVAAGSDGSAVIVDKVSNIGAGVAMAAAPSGSVSYGWIQTGGLATIAGALGGSPSAGNSLVAVGASNGTLTKATAATEPVVAIAYDVSARKVLLTCP